LGETRFGLLGSPTPMRASITTGWTAIAAMQRTFCGLRADEAIRDRVAAGVEREVDPTARRLLCRDQEAMFADHDLADIRHRLAVDSQLELTVKAFDDQRQRLPALSRIERCGRRERELPLRQATDNAVAGQRDGASFER